MGIIFGRALLQYYRCKGAERLTKLNAGIDNFFHFSAARIGKDRTIPQCPRSPFEATLKEGNYFACQHISYHHLRPPLGILDELIRTTGGLDSTHHFLI